MACTLLGSDVASKRNRHHTLATAVLLVVAAGLSCMQAGRWIWRGYDADAAIQAASATAAFTPSEAGEAFLGGRNYRQRILQAQLRDKELEVDYLRRQLDSAMKTSKHKDDNMLAAEATIRQLREREEAEKTARSKAQLALAEKVSALQSCQYQRETLLLEVDRCGQNLNAVMGAHQAHLL